jgi:TP901 family phage tail tape measure protein
MAGRFSIEAIFKAKDAFSAPIAKMSSSFQRFARAVNAPMKELNSVVNKATGGLKTAAIAAGAAGVAGGAALLSFGRAGADFEQAITNVGAVSLMTRDQIADLEKKALELGATTKFSATEVANGMELMGKAGFTTTEILQGIGGVLAAAAADGAELADTAGNISNVLKGMGLETSQASRVADVLTLASSRTNSSIASLGESMSNVSSTARQFRIPLEDTVAAVALLQDVGLDASEAGSAVNTMLTKLAAPTDDVRAQMKKMGVSFQDAHGNMLPLGDVMAQLAKSAEKSGGNMEQVAFFADLVGLRGQKAAANLKDLFISGKASTLTAELRNAAGSAEKMAGIRMDTLKGDLETLGGSVDAFKIGLFNLNSGPLRDVVKGMTDWIDKNQGVITSGIQGTIEGIGKAMPTIVEWLERAGRAAVPILAVAAGVKAWSIAQWLLNAAMTANPATLWILGLTAMAALIAAFWPEIKAAAGAAWQWISDKASAAWSAITAFAQTAWDAIKGIVTGFIEFHVGIFTAYFRLLKWIFSPLMPILQPIFDAIVGAATWVMAQWEPLKAFFSGLWEGIKLTFSNAWAGLMLFATAAVDALKAVWAPIADFFSSLWDGIASAFQAILGGVIDTIMGAVNAIRGMGRETIDATFGSGEPADTGTAAAGAQVTPATSTTIARSIQESNTTSRGEVTIKDTTGKAKITQAPKGNGFGLTLQPSGSF